MSTVSRRLATTPRTIVASRYRKISPVATTHGSTSDAPPEGPDQHADQGHIDREEHYEDEREA